MQKHQKIKQSMPLTMQRATRQRAAILATLRYAGRPLTPHEVLSGAQHEVAALGIATVYRNLKRLLLEEEIRLVELPGEAARYEAVHHGHEHHHHFLCNRCGRAFDVHGCAEDFARMVPRGFVVQNHDITLYGLCKDCVETHA